MERTEYEKQLQERMREAIPRMYEWWLDLEFGDKRLDVPVVVWEVPDVKS